MARDEYELADHEFSGAFLFMDVKGFTAFSESRAAAQAVRANVGSPARREYAFIGHAVNLAQRLESNATPGRILAAEAVWDAAKDLFTEAERKELVVKGRTQTVAAYECRIASRAVTRPEGDLSETDRCVVLAE